MLENNGYETTAFTQEKQMVSLFYCNSDWITVMNIYRTATEFYRQHFSRQQAYTFKRSN